MSKDNGGYAFPGDGRISSVNGMTLRDYFAAKAMQSFMQWALDQKPFDGYETAGQCCEAYAKHAYSMADAMLEARK